MRIICQQHKTKQGAAVGKLPRLNIRKTGTVYTKRHQERLPFRITIRRCPYHFRLPPGLIICKDRARRQNQTFSCSPNRHWFCRSLRKPSQTVVKRPSIPPGMAFHSRVSSVMDRQSDLCIPFILHIKISPMAEPQGRKLSFLSYESPTQNARAAYLQAKRLNRLYIYTRAFILHNLSFLCIFMHILLHDKQYKSIG